MSALTVSAKLKVSIQQVDAEIAKLQAVRDKLQAIEEASEDENLAPWLDGVFSDDETSSGDTPATVVQTTSFDRIQSFFRARGKAGASIAEMATAAGVTESAVRQVVYTTRKDNFRKVGKNGREVLYGLKE